VFEAAKAATIHPLAVAINRNAFVQLARSNFLGIFGPAIMAFEEAQRVKLPEDQGSRWKDAGRRF